APYGAAVALDGQLATTGSRQLSLEARFPAFVTGWRFVLMMEAARRARDNYYGIGNDAIYDEHLVTDAQPGYYQAKATRFIARTEIQRLIVGNLRVLAGFHGEHWRFGLPDGASKLAQDLAADVDPTIGRGVNDVTFRAGLVFDNRDDEVSPNTGFLIYGIHGVAKSSIAGDLDYTRTTAAIAAYHPVTENMVVSARFTAQGMGGTPRLGSYYL